MYFTYLIVYFVAYSVYLLPMGRRRSVKKYVEWNPESSNELCSVCGSMHTRLSPLRFKD